MHEIRSYCALQKIFLLGRGCPAAVLRLWTAPDTDQAPIELCGEKGTDSWHYISQGQSARISFTTTDKTIGAAVSYKIKIIL